MGAAWWLGFFLGPAIINFFIPIGPMLLGYAKGCGLDLTGSARARLNTARARRLYWQTR